MICIFVGGFVHWLVFGGCVIIILYGVGYGM